MALDVNQLKLHFNLIVKIPYLHVITIFIEKKNAWMLLTIAHLIMVYLRLTSNISDAKRIPKSNSLKGKTATVSKLQRKM